MLMGLGKVILVDLVRMLVVVMMWVGFFFKVFRVSKCWLPFSSSKFEGVGSSLNRKCFSTPFIFCVHEKL